MTLLGPDPALTAATAAWPRALPRPARVGAAPARARCALPDRDEPEAVTILLARLAGAFFTLDLEAGRALSRQALGVARAARRSAADRLDRRRRSRTPPPTPATCRRPAPALLLARRARRRCRRRALAPHLDAFNRLAWSEYLIEDDRRRDPPRGARHRDRARHRAGPVRPAAGRRAGAEHAAPGRARRGARRSRTTRWRPPRWPANGYVTAGC